MKRVILGVSVLAVAGAAAAACSSSSTPATTSSGDDGGSSSGTTSSSSSGTTSSSGSSSGTTSSSGSGGGTTDAGASLYTTLGGHAGVRGAVDAVVAAELGDPVIASYFFNQTDPPAAGHPSAAQIEECFTDLIATNIGGPEVYPYTVGPFDDAGVSIGDGGAGTGTFTCRSMSAIHQPLKISGAVFDKFVTIAAGVLMAPPYSLPGTSSAFTTLAGLLEGTKTDIVDPNLADAGGDALPYSADAP